MNLEIILLVLLSLAQFISCCLENGLTYTCSGLCYSEKYNTAILALEEDKEIIDEYQADVGTVESKEINYFWKITSRSNNETIQRISLCQAKNPSPPLLECLVSYVQKAKIWFIKEDWNYNKDCSKIQKISYQYIDREDGSIYTWPYQICQENCFKSSNKISSKFSL